MISDPWMVQEIQEWIDQDPERLPWVKEVWWIALRAGAAWAPEWIDQNRAGVDSPPGPPDPPFHAGVPVNVSTTLNQGGSAA